MDKIFLVTYDVYLGEELLSSSILNAHATEESANKEIELASQAEHNFMFEYKFTIKELNIIGK